jgi:spore germination protein GerM
MRRVGLVLALVLVVGAVAFFAWWSTRPAIDTVDDLAALEELDELGTRSITLFFGNRRADGFVSETRTIQARLHRDEEVEAVVAALIEGPSARGAVRSLPPDARLHRAFYDEELRLLYLDFSQELVSGMEGGSTMELFTLGSILKTIAADFPEIEAVQILIDGLEVETLGGHIDLTRPLRTVDWL